jgi:hypothetical protein
MLPLTIYIGLSAIFFSYLLIRTKMNFFVKLLAIPLLVFGSLFAFKFLDSSLGYAYPAEIPAKFIVLGFEVVETKHEKNIELWMRTDSTKTRLYKLPYSKALEEKLMEGEERSGGRPLVGEFENKKHTDADFVMNFKFYPFNLSDVIPKEPPKRNNIQ